MLVRGHPTTLVQPKAARLGWAALTVSVNGTMQFHQVPINDTRPHQLAETCTCGVAEDHEVDGVYVHKAWDNREAYERGSRRVH